MAKVTNLQRLIKIILLDGEEKQKAILDNFEDQDADVFEIDGIEYHIFSEYQLIELMYDLYEDQAGDLISELEYSRFDYSILANYVDIEKYATDKSREFNFDSLEEFGYYLENYEDNYYVYTRD